MASYHTFPAWEDAKAQGPIIVQATIVSSCKLSTSLIIGLICVHVVCMLGVLYLYKLCWESLRHHISYIRFKPSFLQSSYSKQGGIQEFFLFQRMRLELQSYKITGNMATCQTCCFVPACGSCRHKSRLKDKNRKEDSRICVEVVDFFPY